MRLSADTDHFTRARRNTTLDNVESISWPAPHFLRETAGVYGEGSNQVWWNIVCSMPNADAEDCLVFHVADHAESEDDVVLEVAGLSKQHRLFTILLNLLPRSALQCCIFVVGIRYLLSVRNVSDLILNSLALTFLVTVDEMLFAAFAGEQNAAWIQNCKPLRGRSFKWMDWLLRKTSIPVGLLVFFPILVTLCYFVISNKLLTDQLAGATYCFPTQLGKTVVRGFLIKVGFLGTLRAME